MELSASLVLARWLSLSAVMILFGASAFELYAPGGGSCRGLPRRALLLLAALAGIAELGWLAALAGGLDPGEPLATSIGAVLFETQFGPVWLVRLVLGGGLLAAAALRSAPGLAIMGFGWLGCEGWDGHAAAQGLSGGLVQGLHVVCAGAWIGGLVPLYRTVRAGADAIEASGADILKILSRFSQLAAGLVLVILATGVLNTLNVLGLGMGPGAYAVVLGIKLSLVGVMILLATINRFVHMPLANGADPARALRRIAAGTLTEQLVGVLVLLDVSALGLMSPFNC